jgi:hypothetical protein
MLSGADGSARPAGAADVTQLTDESIASPKVLRYGLGESDDGQVCRLSASPVDRRVGHDGPSMPCTCTNLSSAAPTAQLPTQGG